MRKTNGSLRHGIRSAILVVAVLGVGGAVSALKLLSAQDAQAAQADQPEPTVVVADAVAAPHEHRSWSTAIGTVLAIRSVALRNEVPGTVDELRLVPGRIVEEGEVLVALDVSVERAELRALEARAELARTNLARFERMAAQQAASAIELDNARAERDITLADIARVQAIIERKTIRAPFRAQVGLADVHPGQFLDAGQLLTTLQGVDAAVHVDFSVSQSVAAALAPGDEIEVLIGQQGDAAVPARVAALDARVDPSTRNALVRARLEGAGAIVSPGSSVRVRVPVGAANQVVLVPASAVRRGPSGDHVFVLQTDGEGRARAHTRPVRVGPSLGRNVVVEEGLEVGERVAAAGSFKLLEGALVSVAGGTSERVAATTDGEG